MCKNIEHQAKQLAEKCDFAADQIMQRAKTDPSLCQPYYDESGERCPPKICAVGILRQQAQKFRAQQ